MVSLALASKANSDLAANSRGVTPRQLADIQNQRLITEHFSTPKELHLSNEDSNEYPQRELADSNSRDTFSV